MSIDPPSGFNPSSLPPPPCQSQPNVSAPLAHSAPHPPPHAAGYTDSPPRYSRLMNRYAMRWPLFISAGLGFIWALASGVYSIQDMGNDGETSKEKLFDVLLGILYFAVAGIEAVAIVIGVMQRVKLAKMLLLLAPIGAAVAVAAQIIVVVEHYVVKNDMINQCITSYTGATEVDRFGNTSSVDAAEAKSLCSSSWSSGTWRVFAYLVVIVLLAIFFSGIAMQYYRQLQNPPAPISQSIPLQPYANNPPPPSNYWSAPSSQQQPWMVPPYPGPPPPGQEPFEKGDYQPAAEWAQNNYAPPAGAPSQASREYGAHREEEEAWERARSEGVTAHLTGHAPARQNRDSGADLGYTVGNREEDEAWERARGEGVTAHLTGHNKPRRDDHDVV